MRADSEKPRWTGEPGPAAPRWQAEQEGLTEGETETQRWLWAPEVAMVKETPSSQESQLESAL